jgi:methionine-rich copper-binding protein CopC
MMLPRLATQQPLRTILAAAAGAGATWALAAPAAAHVHLVSTTPANAAVVTRPPTSIRLQFNAPVEERFARFELRRAGRVVAAGPLRRAGKTTLVARLASRLRRGAYVGRFRVVSGDGHPIVGQWKFTVRGRPSTK